MKKYALMLMLALCATQTWADLAAAEKGDVEAQFELAEMYYKEGNYTQAADLYNKAAEQGFAQAQNELGAMYDSGQGVPQDYIKAAYWTRKAAEQGLAEAQFELGIIYIEGRGVPKDLVLGYMLVGLAAVSDDEYAIFFRKDLTKQLSPTQLAQAQKLAANWQIGQSLPTTSDSELNNKSVP